MKGARQDGIATFYRRCVWLGCFCLTCGLLLHRFPCSSACVVVSARVRLSPELTFVSVPKPQLTDWEVQKSLHVLAFWLRFPSSRVVLCASEAAFDPLCRVCPVLARLFSPDRLVFTGDLPVGYGNRPLVREWFRRGVEFARSGFLCFLNADIVPSRAWVRTAVRFFGVLDSRRTVVYGIRSDVYNRSGLSHLDLSDVSFQDRVESFCRGNFRRNNVYGMDVIFIHSGFSGLNWTDFPDFVVGLCFWDVFFQGWANRECDTVVMRFNPRVFHLDHGGNKCNDSNRQYFRMMGETSRLNVSFELYDKAIWRYDGRGGVVNRRTGEKKYLA